MTREWIQPCFELKHLAMAVELFADCDRMMDTSVVYTELRNVVIKQPLDLDYVIPIPTVKVTCVKIVLLPFYASSVAICGSFRSYSF